jgi:Ca2+-binding RTX toxin-like protein
MEDTSGEDVSRGGGGNDTILGSEGSYPLTGTKGADAQIGGSRDSATIGSSSAGKEAETARDVLHGEAGKDRYDAEPEDSISPRLLGQSRR